MIGLPVVLLGCALLVAIVLGLAMAGQHTRKLEALRIEVQVLRRQLDKQRSATVRAVGGLCDAVDAVDKLANDTAHAVHDLQAHDVLRN